MDLLGLARPQNYLGQMLTLGGSRWVNYGNVQSWERNTARSFVFMAARTNASTGGYLLCRMGPGPSFGYAVLVQNDGTVALDLVNTVTTNELFVQTTTSLPLNGVVPIAVTYDGSSSTSGVGIYFGGISQPLTGFSTLSATIVGGTPNLILGAHNSSGTAALPCKVARYAQYTKVLTTAEILAAGGNFKFADLLSVGATGNLVHYSPVTTSDTTSTIDDASSSNNNGTGAGLSASDFVRAHHHELRAA